MIVPLIAAAAAVIVALALGRPIGDVLLRATVGSIAGIAVGSRLMEAGERQIRKHPVTSRERAYFARFYAGVAAAGSAPFTVILFAWG